MTSRALRVDRDRRRRNTVFVSKNTLNTSGKHISNKKTVCFYRAANFSGMGVVFQLRIDEIKETIRLIEAGIRHNQGRI